MEKIVCSLTVLFEDPFWIGLYERRCGAGYEAAKIVFGAEPKDPAVYAFLLENWGRLRFSPPVSGAQDAEKAVNPKRLRRMAARAVQPGRTGTKAQQAMQLMHEQAKLQRKNSAREEREAEAQRRYTLRRAKQKEKRRGH
ncbi:MAG: YjdF family protein [Oscillospiraceae bacterium]|nr:YjdF family protein [Oscillospiraceae bacterium]